MDPEMENLGTEGPNRKDECVFLSPTGRSGSSCFVMWRQDCENCEPRFSGFISVSS